jgi:putative CocE/NonD family hydrolase
MLWEPPLDLAELEAQKGVVTWTGDALDHDLVVHGWSKLEIWAVSDCEDTDWHVKLADVDATGRALLVACGCLRASHGADPRKPTPIVPGTAVRYSIELAPAFHTFRARHQLRVVLASSEFPWFARNLNTFGPIADQCEPRIAVNTVLHGVEHPSSLVLYVEP